MVWGSINNYSRLRLLVIHGNLTASRYVSEILRPELLPLGHIPILFQQDNTRPYMARLTQDFSSQEGINILPWPSRSLDLNLIEPLWDELAVSFIDVNTCCRLWGSWQQRFSKSGTSLDVLSDSCVVQCNTDYENIRNVQVDTFRIDVARYLVDP